MGYQKERDMERTIQTKFFTYDQNNSGGYLIVNDRVAAYVIIEARNEEEAEAKMWKVVQNDSEYCSCCGSRWSSYLACEDDGTDEPMIYEHKIKEAPREDRDSSTIIYYYDSTIEKLWYPEE